jgi:hypothetical protein
MFENITSFGNAKIYSKYLSTQEICEISATFAQISQGVLRSLACSILSKL